MVRLPEPQHPQCLRQFVPRHFIRCLSGNMHTRLLPALVADHVPVRATVLTGASRIIALLTHALVALQKTRACDTAAAAAVSAFETVLWAPPLKISNATSGGGADHCNETGADVMSCRKGTFRQKQIISKRKTNLRKIEPPRRIVLLLFPGYTTHSSWYCWRGNYQEQVLFKWSYCPFY